MSSEQELAIRIRLSGARSAVADADATRRAIGGVGSTTERFGRQARDASSHFKLMSTTVGAFKYAAGAAAVGIAGLAYGLRGAVDASIQLQSQQSQLQSALKASGVQGSAAFDRMTKAADSLAGRGGFSTPEQLQGMTQFVGLTHSATEAIKLNAAATDIARRLHTSYARAVSMVSRASIGQTGRLQQYLGVIQPVTTYTAGWTAAMKKANPVGYAHAEMMNKQATAATALARIQQKFGGATAAYSKTAGGAMSNLKQDWEVIKAGLGKAFLPVVSMVARTITGLLPQIQKTLGAVQPPLAKALQLILPPFLKGMQLIFPPILKVIQSVIPPLMNAVTAILPTLSSALTSLMPLLVSALQLILPPLVSVIKLVLPPLVSAIQKVFPPVVRAISQIIAVLAPAMGLLVRMLAPVMASLIRQLVPPMARLITILVPPLIRIVQALAPVMVSLVNTLAPVITRLILTLAPAMAKLVTTLAPIIGRLSRAFLVLAVPLTTALVKLMPAITLLANAVSAVTRIIPSGNRPAHFGGGGVFADVGNFILNPFGRFDRSPTHRASGGPVPKHFAAGGPSGSDTVPAWLTPGEFVVNRNIVSQVGMPAMRQLNQTGQMGAAAAPQVIELHHTTKLDSRVLAEEVLRYSLRRAARGASTLAGGSLVTS